MPTPALLLALVPLLARAGGDPLPLVLTGARVLAPAADAWLDGLALLVVDARIARIAPEAQLDAPSDAQRHDLAGLFLVPGLIDLHSHLLLHPYDETPWDDQVLRESLELRTVRAVRAARTTLESGFTTVRELGTEGAGFADVALRDAIAAGIVPGPRIFAATRALVATGCYGPSGFDPRIDLPKGAQVADGVDGVRKAVREQVAAGADWIKVYADYRRVPDGPATPTYSPAELAAIVDEATSAGRPVAAHASTDEAVRRAVEAGVATIEHGTHASRETLALMRERGVVLCPTLAAGEAMARYSGWAPGGPEPARLREDRELIARALAEGVAIGCGSDVGVFAHGTSARELELEVAYGLTPVQALRSATTVAARVLGRGGDVGRIAAGFAADLVALAGDPLRDIGALRAPLLVVSAGRVVRDERAGAPSSASALAQGGPRAASAAAPDPSERGAVSAPDQSAARTGAPDPGERSTEGARAPEQVELEAELGRRCVRVLDAFAQARMDDELAAFAPGAVIALGGGAVPVVVPVTVFVERARARGDEARPWRATTPRVILDTDVASVWIPCELDRGEGSSAGLGVFQLARNAGGWAIVSLSLAFGSH